MSKKQKGNAAPVAPAVLKEHAVEAIFATSEIYWKQGGIADLEGTAKELRQDASKGIMLLAQESGSRESFLDACKEAEKVFIADWTARATKNGEKVPKDGFKLTGVDGILPCWSQYKSNISAMWGKGIAPTAFKTESALRTALNKKRKADRPTAAIGASIATPVAAEVNALVAIVKGMPEDAAIAFLKDAQTRAQAALAAILPEEPQQVPAGAEAANG